MTSTDLATTDQPTELTLADEQTYWNDSQVAALAHMGVDKATPGDLAVFFHVVKRTGLDPFARQIYMIGRWSKEGTKYTIQTGIDGYRLIGRRAADRAGVKIRTSAPEWAHEDGTWRPVWSPKWGMPVAARVTVYRDGEPFPGVALFEEYKQTKRDGKLTQMWAQRPAGQIAKCAEALAWRQAFPQDLASVYVEDEMHQAANPEHVEPPAPRATAAQFTTATTSHPDAGPDDTPVVDAIADPGDEPMTERSRGEMFALFAQKGADTRDKQMKAIKAYAGIEPASRGDLTESQALAVIEGLRKVRDPKRAPEDIPDAEFAAAAQPEQEGWEG